MLRKLLLPALAIATLAGCATGYSYRGGNGDYYYGQPSVEYRYYGGYGYGYGGLGGYGYGSGSLGGYGRGYYLDVFGRPVYGYPYGYYGGRYPSYPYRHPPRPRPPHGHDHDGDHDNSPPGHDGPRPGNRPPWRDIGRLRDRDGDEQIRPRQLGQPATSPRMQPPSPRVRQSAPVMRERSESRPMSSGGSGERSRVRAARPSAND